MFHFYKYDTRGYQIDLAGYSFFFISKRNVAFREKNRKTIFVSDEYYNTPVWEEVLRFVSKEKCRIVDQDLFQERLTTAYNRAILEESRRIGMEAMNLEENNDNSRPCHAGASVDISNGIVP